MTEYEPMMWEQDSEPEQDGFGDQYDIIIKSERGIIYERTNQTNDSSNH